MNSDIEIEQFIRQEMNRLDSVTGIDTTKSPIYLTDSYNLAGTYSPTTYPDCFSFSRKFFSDNEIDTQILLYIVRHEYAHCMNNRIYNQRGHGCCFMYCCELINCYPDKKVFDFLRKKTESYIFNDSKCVL